MEGSMNGYGLDTPSEIVEAELIDDDYPDIIDVEPIILDASRLGFIEISGGLALGLMDRAEAIYNILQVLRREKVAQESIAKNRSVKEVRRAQRTVSSACSNLARHIARLNVSTQQRELGVSELDVKVGEQEIERAFRDRYARAMNPRAIAFQAFRTAGTSLPAYDRLRTKQNS